LPEKLELVEKSLQVFTVGERLSKYVDHYLHADTPDRATVLQEIKEEKRQFLFNEHGEFANYSKPRKPANE
jgi:hypothetical protein